MRVFLLDDDKSGWYQILLLLQDDWFSYRLSYKWHVNEDYTLTPLYKNNNKTNQKTR